MTGGERRQIAEGAQRGSIIDAIGMSLERFNGNLSDDRKIKLFAMQIAELKKLASDVEKTQTSFKAISQIVAAIAVLDQDRQRDAHTRSEGLGVAPAEGQSAVRGRKASTLEAARAQKRVEERPRGKARPR